MLEEDASAMVAPATWVSTYVFTAFSVGNFTSEFEAKVASVLLLAVFSLVAKEVVTSELFAFNANPGTVGAAAVPPKSPANWIFPLLVVVASGIVELTI